MIHTVPLILRFAPTDQTAATGYFAGLASTRNVDRHGEAIARGAFAKTIAALQSGKQRVPLLHGHNQDLPIGAITSAEETDEGLAVEGKIALGTPIADRAHQMLAVNALGLSVGFIAQIEGKHWRRVDGVKTYTDVDWVETSVVAIPANRQSVVHTVRGLGDITPADFERMLRDGELPALPRRLAAKITRACLGTLAEHEEEPEHDPAKLAALQAALARTITNLKSR
jgi:uncharacterized protein